MYDYEIDDAIESVMDDMDDYDYYGYDDTDAFCDALESMVYDMADYLCYEKGYSEDEALEAANVYYGCALETSSQIKQVRNQARKTYNKAQKAAKRGDTYTANQLAAQAKTMDRKVRNAKNKVDAAITKADIKSNSRYSQHVKQQSQKPGYAKVPGYNMAESKNVLWRNEGPYNSGHHYGSKYIDSTTRDYLESGVVGRGATRQVKRTYTGVSRKHNVY